MRIAQIAPLWERVPPVRYGGTELVIHLITEELVKRGHEVTLFATADSETSARLVSTIPKPFREYFDISQLIPTSNEVSMHQLKLLGQLLRQAGEFDIIHNHTAFQAIPFVDLCPTPMLTTIHSIFEPPTLKELLLEHRHLPYVSISDYQRTGCPELNYVDTVYHGLNLDYFSPSFSSEKKGYLAFLGRFSPEKGAHLALKAAKETGWPLILAGKINSWEQDFFDAEIKPHLDGKNYKMIGEVDLSEKNDLLRNAAATLFPIQWAEPFGLVMIESMACGTPVIAFKNGSVPEVIDHGVSGLIVNTYDEMVQAIRDIDHLHRETVYECAVKRFTVDRMVDNYVTLYQQLIDSHQGSSLHSSCEKAISASH